ncbi:OmpA family protein [Cellulomonas sp. KH9]|uniref:OmpA family protein n=1 Tax=Cellulomonas sp. KH9 TaxID=1855324 RepID=UPI0008E0A529|nr:OmpA family protein [Cellulomonas sp. KH9]SFK27973.1 Outer membrane protein OmpA [Cellulomonas sp. KH9]
MSVRRAGLVVPVVAVLLTAATPASAPVLTVDDFPAVTQDALERAVVRLSDESLDKAVLDFSEDARIRPLAGTETQGEQTVVTLATDILFAVDDATVPPSATDEIAALLADVPDGAALAVEGHTDSVASDAHNQDLSDRRATAVADVVRTARPDLAVTATGYGETRLKVEESGDDVAEDRAQNRRVELRYDAVAAAPSPTALATPTPLVPAPSRTGTTPAVRGPAAEATAVAQTRVPAPGYPGLDLVVGVEDVRVRGAVTELSLLVELAGPGVAAIDRPGLFGALDQTSWDVTLVDRAGLLQYPALTLVWGVIEWEGEGDVVSSDISSVHRFVVTFPRLLAEEGTVDVVLDPALPVIADVPVTRE